MEHDLSPTQLYVLIGLGAGLLLGPGLMLASSYLNNSVPADDAVLHAPDGPTATFDEDTTANLTAPFPNQTAIEWESAAGNVTLLSSGATTVTVDQANGTWTNLSAMDVTSNTLKTNPDDKPWINVSGQADALKFRDPTLDDGQPDLVISGTSGSSTVTIPDNFGGTSTITAVNQSTGGALDVASNSGGTYSLTIDHSTSQVLLQSGDQSSPPTQSNASPTGGQGSEPSQFEADVDDGDFPDDDLTAFFYYEGSQTGTDTTSSAGKVTASIPSAGLDGGKHNWSLNVTDKHGNWANQSYQYSIPQNLTIYNESQPTQVLSNANVSLRFYFDENSPTVIANRTTKNGTIPMTGLPKDEPFIVVARSDGFYTRRIFVGSLYETQRIFLLPESKTVTQTIFELNDFTGDYPKENTVLEVERGLNNSWQTVVGDFFGATSQFTAELRYNHRHRLRLRNIETNQTRLLGPYTPLTSGTEKVQISPTEGITNTETLAGGHIKPDLRRVPGKDPVNISARVVSNDDSIEEWNVSMFLVGSNSNQTIRTYNDSSPGKYEANINLTNNASKHVEVVLRWNTSSGGWTTMRADYTINRAYIDGGSTFFGALSSFLGLLPGGDQDATSSLIALAIVLLSSTIVSKKYRLSTEITAVVGLALMAAMAMIGWLGYDLLFAAVVAAAAIAYLRRGY